MHRFTPHSSRHTSHLVWRLLLQAVNDCCSREPLHSGATLWPVAEYDKNDCKSVIPPHAYLLREGHGAWHCLCSILVRRIAHGAEY